MSSIQPSTAVVQSSFMTNNNKFPPIKSYSYIRPFIHLFILIEKLLYANKVMCLDLERHHLINMISSIIVMVKDPQRQHNSIEILGVSNTYK